MGRKTTNLCIVFMYLLLLVCLNARAGSANHDERKAYFDHWRNVPTKELKRRALDIINNGGNMDSALIYYNVVYNRYVLDPDDKQKAKDAAGVLNNMGYLMSMYYFDYERAEAYLAQSLELSQRFGFEEKLPYIYVNLGNIVFTQRAYVSPGDMVDALPYFKKGFYIAARLKDWNIMLVNLTNMIGMTNSLDSPVPYDSISREIDIFDKLKIPAKTKMLAYSRQDALAYKAMRAGRYEEEIAIGERALAAIPSFPDSMRYVLNTRSEQAASLMRLGRCREALDMLQSQLQVVRKAGIKDLESEIYLDMMLVCQNMGDKERARDYEYQYLKSKDEMLFGNHKLAKVEQAHLMRELNKANAEVEEEVRHRHRIIAFAWTVIAFLVIIGGFTIALVRKNRRLRESYRKMYSEVQDAVKKEETKYKNSSLDESRRAEIVGKIESVFADKNLLCSEDMSLSRLSELTGTPYKLVSQTINEHWQKNFSQLLSEYRIHEACRRMQDKERYGNYTIEAVGTSVGFHTRSNFVTTFKRITGLTPSEYIHETEQKDR